MSTLVLVYQWLSEGQFELTATAFFMLNATFSTWLAVALLFFYFPVTWKKRCITVNVLGMAGALMVFIRCVVVRFVSERVYEIFADRSDSGFSIFLYCLPVLVAVSTLLAFVFCGMNVIQRKAFSNRQIWSVALPYWIALSISLVVNVWGGITQPENGFPIYSAVGLSEFMMAVILTFAVREYKTKGRMENDIIPPNTTRGGSLF